METTTLLTVENCINVASIWARMALRARAANLGFKLFIKINCGHTILDRQASHCDTGLMLVKYPPPVPAQSARQAVVPKPRGQRPECFGISLSTGTTLLQLSSGSSLRLPK